MAPPVGADEVLTSGFPSVSEMVRWIWGHVFGWSSANLLWVSVVLVAAVVWYMVVIVRRAITSV